MSMNEVQGIQRYNLEQVHQILKGASMLASGGGGSYKEAVKLLEDCRRKILEVYPVGNQQEDNGTVVFALMGNPTELQRRDLKKIILNTASLIKKLSGRIFEDGRKNIKYGIPVEMGGFNTAVPIYLAMISKGTAEEIKLLDADGCGRAVPGLDTAFITQRGCSITPFILASDKELMVKGTVKKESTVIFESCDAKSCEDAARKICEAYGNLAGVAGWPFLTKDIKKYALENSISGCYNISRSVERYFDSGEKTGLFEYLTKNPPFEGFKGETIAPLRGSISCDVISDGNEMPRFDIGKIILEEKCTPTESRYYAIKYVNESLVLYRIDGPTAREDSYRPIVTAPDIITVFDVKEKRSLSNDEIVKKFRENDRRPFPVCIGAIESTKWWELVGRDTVRQTEIWKKYFESVGYKGKCIDYFRAVR